VIAPLVALAAIAWLVLLVVTPYLAAPLAAISYSVGSFICHQMPERSFHLSGYQLPVCARCLGIYAGVALAALSPLDSRTARFARGRRAIWVFGISALATVLTLALEWTDLWSGSNGGRAVAGVALGIGVGLVVMNAVATLHYSACVPRRPTVISPPQRRT
jgi:uncharacterized membrane protein